MSIFNKVNELFYVRPINLASNSTRCERDADGEDLLLGTTVSVYMASGGSPIAGAASGVILILSAWMLKFWSSS